MIISPEKQTAQTISITTLALVHLVN